MSPIVMLGYRVWWTACQITRLSLRRGTQTETLQSKTPQSQGLGGGSNTCDAFIAMVKQYSENKVHTITITWQNVRESSHMQTSREIRNFPGQEGGGVTTLCGGRQAYHSVELCVSLRLLVTAGGGARFFQTPEFALTYYLAGFWSKTAWKWKKLGRGGSVLSASIGSANDYIFSCRILQH